MGRYGMDALWQLLAGRSQRELLLFLLSCLQGTEVAH